MSEKSGQAKRGEAASAAPASSESIRLRGAKTHNLKGVDLDFVPASLVAIAGVSGAGKSSLAFSTLYAEGQRRYVESFSPYVRQFLERLARPPVDLLEPVPAGIAVDRQAPVKTSRSTVGTMTDLADYGKTLWARAATLQCPGCGGPVHREGPTSAAEATLAQGKGRRVVVTYPLPVEDTGQFLGVREGLLAEGYRRIWVSGEARELESLAPSELGLKGKSGALMHVVADRTVAKDEERERLVEAFEAAFRQSGGRADLWWGEGGEPLSFSRGLHCARCDRAFQEPTPALFSFNSPVGACPSCRGFGRVIQIDFDRVLPDDTLSLEEGAVRPWQGKSTSWERNGLKKHAAKAGIPMDVPLRDLDAKARHWLIEGDELGYPKGWWGIRAWFSWLESRAYKMHVRVLLSRYRKYERCPDCQGKRLRPEALQWKIEGRSLADFFALPAEQSLALIEGLGTQAMGRDPALALLLEECGSRLRALVEVGLGYLSLDRAARTLSGGEAQRVALTAALGASLSGAMFVLDEPSVGLHPQDVARLGGVVRRLADAGNLVLLVEHDLELLRQVDRVVELGPAAGDEGGCVVFDGSPAELSRASTPTGRALRAGPKSQSEARRKAGAWLRLEGATGNNLRDVTLELPLGVATCITGVSGSGKSSLILDTLCPALHRHLGGEREGLPYRKLEGWGALKGLLEVDQSPLGRTSRGNPATYLKIWEAFRKRFAAQPLAKERGYGPGFFSFNVAGGRCEACKGEGAETVEMQFLADVSFSCPECGGRRFAGGVLDVLYREHNVADLLEMSAQRAFEIYGDDKEIGTKLRLLIDLGLGYLRLGQALNTLSGGESQRLKLAAAVAGFRPGSMVVLDEPTAGLHPQEVPPLLQVLRGMVKRGGTVVVIEHDMRVAAWADHLIELGPGAGPQGGRIVAQGTPEKFVRSAAPSAEFLKPLLAPTGKAKTASSLRTKAAARITPRERSASAARALEGRVSDIRMVGVREHNWKNVSVDLPRDALIVVSGPSGSGKSSLAFDVLYAEAQRRFLETLSPYARQYMPQLPRPAVDRVLGVPPAVSLEQHGQRGGSQSTVATLTEVAHYLRLLYARIGLLHCPGCRVPIEPRSPAMLAEDLRKKLPASASLRILAPVIRGRKGIHKEVFDRARREGLQEVRVDGEWQVLKSGMKLDRYQEHDIDWLVATHKVRDAALEESLRRAAEWGEGAIRVLHEEEEWLLSTRRACPACGRGFPELDPRFFSFNTRQGACERCEGKGVLVEDEANEVYRTCPACEGSRLSELARAVEIGGRNLAQVSAQSVERAFAELSQLRLGGRDAAIGAQSLEEAKRRLRFLLEVGLGYLGLDRRADTLSGGELQRVRLAAQLGSGLTGALYVLDEPTIGLHPRDTHRLIDALRRLVEARNTVLVVEHDADVIAAADHVLDVGPGGGSGGGNVVAAGTLTQLQGDPRSVTGPALAQPLHLPTERRPVRSGEGEWLSIRGAAEHNLRALDVDFPLARLVAVSGVSGSGKSTLVRDVLLPATQRALGSKNARPGRFVALEGSASLKRALEVDQSPIGRTPRSVPATYIGVWDAIRRLFAGTAEARARGYGLGRFSFNAGEGRCETCAGQGAIRVEMAFLPEVLVPCEVCAGKRFNAETLQVRWQGLNVAEILALPIEQAAQVFAPVSKIARPLQMMAELGLGYLQLGQPSNTLSGGEAQRLKLVAELASGSESQRSLYVLDEPTTGLHRVDVERLLLLLQRLVERGDSVIVIEHQLDVIAAADWVIELGPEGGEGGGELVVQGTPEDLIACRKSPTGQALAQARGPKTVSKGRSGRSKPSQSSPSPLPM